MKQQRKTPKRLSGFLDFFAEDMMIRNFVIDTFKEVYEKYGYEPLETPSLEYTELMMGISGSEAEKQFYRFEDNGGRDVMLKFEVMTSMCRALAQNINNVPLPYKRYQIQRVWRAEKAQKGRYREFTQSDADTIGTRSMTADAEFIQMGLEIVGKLGFEQYEARISNKKFLEGLADYLNIPKESWYGFQISIDKLEKIGKEAVIAEMINERGISRDAAEKAMELIDPEQFSDKSFKEIIAAFNATVGSTERGKNALTELTEIADYLVTAKVDPTKYRFDTTIARGLASYTGPVWEFTIKDGNVGSIAGCGRYDNTIGKYLGYDVPATGGSFGIERICDILKDRKMTNFGATPVDVLVTQMDEALVPDYIAIANKLRDGGSKVMLYPEVTDLSKQLKYANKKGIEKVVILGSDEKGREVYKVKDMVSGEEEEQQLNS